MLITSVSLLSLIPCGPPILLVSSSPSQIENLQEQLRDKDKQLGNLKDRVKSLQTDSSNTDTALATLEEALSEKVQQNGKLGVQRCISVMAGILPAAAR